MTNVIKQTTGKRITKVLIIALGVLFFQACSSGDGSPRFKDVEEIEVSTTSQGVISEIEEVEPGNEYTVIDEKVIDNKAESYAIVHNLDQTIDTVSFAKLASNESEYRNSRGLRTFLMGTLAATYFHRNFNRTKIDPKRYKNSGTYNKSKGLKGSLAGTASTRRVKVPGKASKGYGGSRSFRSFGG